MKKLLVLVIGLAFVAGCANTGEMTKDLNSVLAKLTAATTAATKDVNAAKDAKAVVAGVEKVEKAMLAEFKAYKDKYGNALGTESQAKKIQDGAKDEMEKFTKAITEFSTAVGGKMGEFAEDSKIISDALSKFVDAAQSLGK